MSDPHWLAMLIGIVAAALLLTGLLLKAALGKGHPKGKMCQLAAAYRRFSPGVPGRDRRLRLKLLVLLVLVILNVVVLGFLLSRAPGERAVESTSTQIATPGGVSSSAGRSAASELGAVRRMGRPFSWRIWPTPPGPSKPFESKVRTRVGQRPSCVCSAGREASAWPSRYPRKLTSRAGSPPMWNLINRVVTTRAGPQLRCDVQTLCVGDQGLTAPSHQPSDPPTAASLAKTTTLSRYLCLAAS
jgi:hypothetical protein